jgi:hypothetical protein
LDCKANIDFRLPALQGGGLYALEPYTSGEYRQNLPGHDSQFGFRLVSMYKPASDQVKSQLAVMSGSHVTHESVIALLPERNETQLVPTEVQKAGGIWRLAEAKEGSRRRNCASEDQDLGIRDILSPIREPKMEIPVNWSSKAWLGCGRYA